MVFKYSYSAVSIKLLKHDWIPCMQKFSRYEIFAEQQVNRNFAIIFLQITGPKFSPFSLVSISYHMATNMLQNDSVNGVRSIL